VGNRFAKRAQQEIKYYADQGIPYIGYAWQNKWNEYVGGYAVYRKDPVTVLKERHTGIDKAHPNENIPAGTKLKFTAAAEKRILKTVERLRKNRKLDVEFYVG
jgi:hypothetical protein